MTEKEYNHCVSLFADNVYRFIFKNLGNKEDSKDVVQTAFEKLWVNREQVDNNRSKSFLFTVAYHQMIDHIRKNKRISFKEEHNIERGVTYQSNNNIKKILDEALQKLGETQRSLVLLNKYGLLR